VTLLAHFVAGKLYLTTIMPELGTKTEDSQARQKPYVFRSRDQDLGLERPVTVIHLMSFCSGFAKAQLGTEHGRTQRRRHITDGLLWIRRVLVNQPDLFLSQFRRLRYRLLRLVLPLHCKSCQETFWPQLLLSLSRTPRWTFTLVLRSPESLVLLVLPLHRGAGVYQQLYQPVHLRRQVPWVPARRQTSHQEGKSDGVECFQPPRTDCPKCCFYIKSQPRMTQVWLTGTQCILERSTTVHPHLKLAHILNFYYYTLEDCRSEIVYFSMYMCDRFRVFDVTFSERGKDFIVSQSITMVFACVGRTIRWVMAVRHVIGYMQTPESIDENFVDDFTTNAQFHHNQKSWAGLSHQYAAKCILLLDEDFSLIFTLIAYCLSETIYEQT